MDINVTLFFQVVVFALFVWFTMKFIWPPISQALEERQTSIADGLAAAEKGRQALESAHIRFKELEAEGRERAVVIIEQANKRAQTIVDEARQKARSEGERLLQVANSRIEQEYTKAKEELTAGIFDLVIAGSERVLAREVDYVSNKALVDQLLSERK